MARKTTIGGQALIEGIMMRGPQKSAMAVRDPEGKIVVEEHATKGKDRPKICKVPVIRGVFNMYDSLTYGYKCLMRSAELSGMDEEDNKKKKKEPSKWDTLMDKLLMPAATVLAVVLAFALFLWLPLKIFSWIESGWPALLEMKSREAVPYGYWVIKAAITGVMRIIVFIGYVWGTSLMKDIRRTYQYHGAEHKCIFCYEAELPLTVENVRPQSRLHPRCGTSFLILMLIVGIIIGMFIHIDNSYLYALVKLATFPLVIGLGYELIKLAGRYDNVFTRVISAPGKALQLITTREPDDSMIECAIEAMQRVIPEDGSDRW